MITKEVTYRNVFGNTVTKELYFGLTRAELLELEADWYKDGGVKGRYERVEKAGAAEEPAIIISTFKELLRRSYGERVNDEFEKSESIANRFTASEAYSEVLFHLLEDMSPEWDANAFMRGILPANTDLNNIEATPSEVARQRWEAQMQGHQKKSSKPSSDEPEQAPAETEDEKRARLYREFQAQKEAEKAAEEPVDPEFEEFLRKNS